MGGSSDLARPSWRRLLAEAPALVRLVAAQLRGPRAQCRKVAGGPVMVIPAFLASDLLTKQVRRTLRACGYRAYGWGQGVNFGANARKFARLLDRIDELSDRESAKLVLIGWSLGGLYARELAKRRPGKVAAVVTLGTPFSQNLRLNNAWKLYELVNDHDVYHPPVPITPAAKPPVYTVAIWSGRDGIVAPASASGALGETDDAVRVEAPHNELVSHPAALDALLSVLGRIPSAVDGMAAEPAAAATA